MAEGRDTRIKATHDACALVADTRERTWGETVRKRIVSRRDGAICRTPLQAAARRAPPRPAARRAAPRTSTQLCGACRAPYAPRVALQRSADCRNSNCTKLRVPSPSAAAGWPPCCACWKLPLAARDIVAAGPAAPARDSRRRRAGARAG